MSNHNDKNKLNSGEGLTSNVEVNPEPSQICRICNKLKSIDNFHKNKRNNNGFDYRCKLCKKLVNITMFLFKKSYVSIFHSIFKRKRSIVINNNRP